VGPLSGIRVIDVSQVLAGPFCTMLLGDMGADVIKVEAPGTGDPSRRMDPLTPSGESGAFLAVNRNKRGVALDLKDGEAREVLLALVAGADVFVENYRPGVARRIGIDYQSLRAVNDRLIYASVSGFGQSGPYAHRAGFDLIAQGMSGIMSVTGNPGSSPVKCGIPVTDLGAGLFAVYGILAALQGRHQTGTGQRVDTSLFEAGLSLAVWEATEHFYTGRVTQPTGSAHRLSAPYQAFRARDGYITVAADSERHWPVFCRALGLEGLIDDPRFHSNEVRLQNLADLVPLIEARTVTHDSAHWLEEFERLGIASGPINSIPEALSDPQTLERGMVVELDHPRAGRIRALGPPVKLSATPAAVERAAPILGQHTEEVLAELGMEPAAFQELRDRKAIA
jgi:crotonobetainyl-CoA:carnitine CoA-transferase CaiB-like acyl-CoA transferase